METDNDRRSSIALATGVTLVRAPTGSGKTLTIGRALEALVGKTPRKTVWFWFTPFSGLVTQTQNLLAAQCTKLRLRNVTTDRNVRDVRDGDIFVLTWQSVAVDAASSRKIRQPGESVAALDMFIAAVSNGGDFRIGAVIDEAHMNFGTSAPRAASFYLGVVKPAFTILASATPKDKELADFSEAAGFGQPNRVEVSREEVVKSCLNKVGITAFHFRPDPKDERSLDMDEVAIWAGIQRHKAIKDMLLDRGVDVTPLLLIQAENAHGSGEDSVNKILSVLKENGFGYGRPGDPVAVHTSAQPDQFFHSLAYDSRKEVLVFKMSAATGFDAPRAWTLVSLRKTIGPEFGLQLLGRIMRVHPALQPSHPFATTPPREKPDILDRGYVFLANRTSNPALSKPRMI